MHTGASFDVCASEEAGPSEPTVGEKLISSCGGLSRPAAAAVKFRCEKVGKVCPDVTRCRRSFASLSRLFFSATGREIASARSENEANTKTSLISGHKANLS